jgi:flagellar hook assembly protein FlgD
MKKIFVYLFLLNLLSTVAYAQSGNYANQWIDYSKTYYKIKVSREAIHRIPYSVLSANGFPSNSASYKLFYKGQEVAIQPSAADMGSNDYIEFYGEPNDGTFDTQLFKQPDWQLSPYKSLFTDTSSYYLMYDPTDLTNIRYQTMVNDLSGTLPAAETHFEYTYRSVINSTFYSGEPFGNLAGQPSHFSTWDNGEGFTGSAIGGAAPIKDYNIPINGIYTAEGGNAHIETRVMGNSNYFGIPDHHLQISLANTTYKDTTYEGYENYKFNFDVPLSSFNQTGNTTITYRSVGDLAPTDYNQVAYIYVTYPHTYDFGLSQIFSFELPNDGNKYIEITNFNGGAAPVLYDITNRQRYLPQAITSNGQTTYRIYLQQVVGAPAKRKLFLSNTGITAIQSIATMQPRNFTDYAQAANQGNYLIISHPNLHTGDVDQVERYALYRNSPQGGSYNTLVVDINQLYDQFAWGIDKNPLSIQNFINYAMDIWDKKPEYLLLLGKSIQYSDFRLNPNTYAKCLVPSYGHHASDVMLSARNIDNYVNQLSTGRIPAQTPNDVRAYLDKIIQHEAPTACTKQDRAWRRKAIHIGGGGNINESNSFLADLNQYKAIYQDTLMGGQVVYTYSKATPDTLSIPEITPYINNGINIINFIGHSASPYWDVKLEPPTHYTNVGKYPFIFSSSCYVGNIHADQNNMSQDFTLAEQSGAIGFVATIAFGFPSLMNKYMEEIYKQFCYKNYDQPIGYAIRESIRYNYLYNSNANGMKLTCTEFNLAGDPAARVVPWTRPEYIIEHSETGYSDISFSPAQITANIDSFAVNVVVSNIGKAMQDSFAVKLIRTFPNGETELIANKRFAATILVDTLHFYVQLGDRTKGSGENQLQIIIDADNEIAEDCEDNNIANVKFFVFSDLLIPIAPCNYSIIPNSTVTLKASTGQPLLASLPYIIQIDTTALFNSPLRKQNVQNSESGVVQWTPNLTLQANTVYYWRTSQIPDAGNQYNWQTSSFIYMPASSQGWNQSHYYQFKNDNYYHMVLDTARNFQYESFNNVINASGDYDSYEHIGSDLNLSTITTANTCLKCTDPNTQTYGGLAFVVYKPGPILEPIPSIKSFDDPANNCNDRGVWGNVQCGANLIYAFEFHTGTQEQVDNMLNFMQNGIPEGYYVLVYSVTNHRLGTTDPTAPIYPHLPQIEAFFNNMGITGLNALPNNGGFIAFGRKGFADYPATVVVPDNANEQYFATINVAGQFNSGTLTSPPIGPSTKWHTLKWTGTPFEIPNYDQTNIHVIGIDNNGTEQLLMDVTAQGDIALDGIDANTYRYLKLKEISADTTFNSPIQLDHWRVMYDMAGELAINQQAYFAFHADTLKEGEHISLDFALTNVSSTNMDSVLIQYTVVDANNVSHILPIPRQAPVAAGQTITAHMDYSTEGWPGNNVLFVDVNPNNDQPEKFRFNNVLILPFFVKSDKINPIMDVTFDGRHIIDGDLVSAQPTIAIKAKDENPYLALNDTSDFSMYIVKPNGNGTLPIYFNSPWVQFTPATDANASNGKNEASVTLNPTLTESGIYQLVVNSRDRSNNNFANRNYQISFEVDTKPAISNLLNYPNPFTSSTQFVFSLSGVKVPQQLKIQIMTVTGRVVREITQAELGQLYIGKNITDFKWDGTDQFGSPLANGLYLYRVVSKLDNEKLDTRATTENVDALFKNNMGKMYLMR